MGARPTKKTLRIAAIVLACIVVIAAIVLVVSTRNSGDGAVSASGKIRVTSVTSDMLMKDGAAIEGSAELEKDATLYYAITNADKKIVGAGNMQVQDKRFSRNVEFISKDNKGKTGQLQVYAQNKEGRQIDSVIIPVKFE